MVLGVEGSSTSSMGLLPAPAHVLRTEMSLKLNMVAQTCGCRADTETGGWELWGRWQDSLQPTSSAPRKPGPLLMLFNDSRSSEAHGAPSILLRSPWKQLI